MKPKVNLTEAIGWLLVGINAIVSFFFLQPKWLKIVPIALGCYVIVLLFQEPKEKPK